MFTQRQRAQTAPMTQARRQLVDPTQAGTFHCVNRCVRQSWLCGFDKYLRQSFEHRKSWVETRILELDNIFACGIHAWAVMSNHLHIVVHMSPATANAWSPEEVAARWVRLYPAHNAELCAQKIAAILENPQLIAEYRARLTNLSWLMKSLSEPIARRANEEDKVRNQQLHKNPERANQPLMPLVGVRSFNLPGISQADYIELVDFTGRELHPGKHGKIDASEPKALTKLGLDKNH